MSDERRRGPGGRGAGIAPATIVTTALALMDEHGVEWLSMRRLAAALGVAPGTLYWHFANKAELCAAVMDEAGRSVEFPRDTSGSPRERLTRHLVALRRHWHRHPSLVALGRTVRPAESGEVTALGVGLLIEMGCTEAEARLHWRALVWLVLGFFFVEGGVAASAHHQAIAGEPGRYAVSLGAQPEVIDAEALFDHLLGLALDGIAARR